uniref:Uncharacterized protein n=1 Tax=Triticum urartu TaxID=4572 RepID=A0A8R7QEN2_TRIUA
MFWECQAFIFKVDSSSSNVGPFTKYGVALGKRNKFSFAAILVACSFQQERNNLMFEWFKAYALCFVSLCPTRFMLIPFFRTCSGSVKHLFSRSTVPCRTVDLLPSMGLLQARGISFPSLLSWS